MMTAHYIRFGKLWQASIFEGGWAYRLLLTTLCLPETAVIKASRRPLTAHVTTSGTRIDFGEDGTDIVGLERLDRLYYFHRHVHRRIQRHQSLPSNRQGGSGLQTKDLNDV